MVQRTHPFPGSRHAYSCHHAFTLFSSSRDLQHFHSIRIYFLFVGKTSVTNVLCTAMMDFSTPDGLFFRSVVRRFGCSGEAMVWGDIFGIEAEFTIGKERENCKRNFRLRNLQLSLRSRLLMWTPLITFVDLINHYSQMSSECFRVA